MCSSVLRHFLAFALTVPILLTIAQLSASAASTEKVLHDFGAPDDGANPRAPLVFDTLGNLYGTTLNGGTGLCVLSHPCGIIFQLIPHSDGSWSENAIWEFDIAGGFNVNPLVFDHAGNLYGAGPCSTLDCQNGAVIFQLAHSPGGGWGFTVLLTSPVQNSVLGGLAFYNAGQLYGWENDPGGYGTTFLLKNITVRNWYEIIAHGFKDEPDGSLPVGALAFDSSGNIYGATYAGGSHGFGTVYKLTPNRLTFGWTETILYQFTGGPDGSRPTGVIIDNLGNLFGTTTSGGVSGSGTVFKLTLNPDGSWSESVVHSFAGGSDGAAPQYAPTLDAFGNVYGTTLGGGTGSFGTVYEVSPSGGQWQEVVLHSFTAGADGAHPYSGVILDNAGNLYGTTQDGGQFGGGVAYEIVP